MTNAGSSHWSLRRSEVIRHRRYTRTPSRPDSPYGIYRKRGPLEFSGPFILDPQ
jgi:hypothetical protein